MTDVRRIRFMHLLNFRDLGGYETLDGRTTVWNRLYRCDCMNQLTDSEWQRLLKLDIRNVIDLRSTFEKVKSPVNVVPGIAYHHLPFLKEDLGIKDPEEASRKFMQSMSLDYAVMLSNSIDEMAAVLKALLLYLSEGNVAFFCTAGKDRTGMVAAAVLYLCGVFRENIIADYVLTEVYNADAILKYLNSLPEDMKSQIPPHKMEMAASSKAPTMRHMLDYMDTHDFTALMAERGFGAGEICELKKLLLF